MEMFRKYSIVGQQQYCKLKAQCALGNPHIKYTRQLSKYNLLVVEIQQKVLILVVKVGSKTFVSRTLH